MSKEKNTGWLMTPLTGSFLAQALSFLPNSLLRYFYVPSPFVIRLPRRRPAAEAGASSLT